MAHETERALRLALGRWAGARSQIPVLGISVALRTVIGARGIATSRLAQGRAKARRLAILRPSRKDSKVVIARRGVLPTVAFGAEAVDISPTIERWLASCERNTVGLAPNRAARA